MAEGFGHGAAGDAVGGWAGGPPVADTQARNWAMAAHLSSLVMLVGVPFFLGPLVAYLLGRDRDVFVAYHAKEALNFSISLVVYAVVAMAVTIATLGIGLIVVVPALLVAAPAWLILTIIAAMKAADGQWYRYPLTMRFVS